MCENIVHFSSYYLSARAFRSTPFAEPLYSANAGFSATRWDSVSTTADFSAALLAAAIANQSTTRFGALGTCGQLKSWQVMPLENNSKIVAAFFDAHTKIVKYLPDPHAHA
jgi:hypothetical protein